MKNIQSQIDTQQKKIDALKEQRKEINRRIKRAEKEIEHLKNKQILDEVDAVRKKGYTSEQIRKVLHNVAEGSTGAPESATPESETDGER